MIGTTRGAALVTDRKDPTHARSADSRIARGTTR